MYADVCMLAEALAQSALNVDSVGMRLIKGHLGRHAQVHIDGNARTDAAGAQMMDARHRRFG